MKHLNRLFMTSAFLIVLLVCDAGYGTQESMYAELNAEGSVTLSPQPEVGKTFEVVFTFRVTDTLSHSRQEPDSAWIRCRDSLIQYVDGDTLWTGYIETGRQYELRCRFRVVSGTRFGMLGGVFARQALGKIEKAITDTGPDWDTGYKSRKLFGIRGIDLRTEQQRIQSERRQPMVRLKVTDNGVVPTDTVWESLRFQKRPDIALLPAGSTAFHRPTVGSPGAAAVRGTERPSYIHLRGNDTLLLPDQPRMEYEFLPESSSSDLDVSLVQGDGSFVRTGPRSGRFQLDTDVAEAVFRVSADSLELIVIVRRPALGRPTR